MQEYKLRESPGRTGTLQLQSHGSHIHIPHPTSHTHRVTKPLFGVMQRATDSISINLAAVTPGEVFWLKTSNCHQLRTRLRTETETETTSSSLFPKLSRVELIPLPMASFSGFKIGAVCWSSHPFVVIAYTSSTRLFSIIFHIALLPANHISPTTTWLEKTWPSA